ncbi:MAG: RCC1 domain-containing protein [Candidatus Sericytochromatia bacterium]
MKPAVTLKWVCLLGIGGLLLLALRAGSASGLTSGVAYGRLAVGSFHACAIVTQGKVKCWGYGEQGQLGNGQAKSSATAVEVAGLSDVRWLSAGEHWTCAVLGNGNVKCWGNTDAHFAPPAERKTLSTCYENAEARRGGHGGPCALRPVTVAGLSGVRAIDLNSIAAYAIGHDGSVDYWMSENPWDRPTLYTGAKLPVMPASWITNPDQIAVTAGTLMSVKYNYPNACGLRSDGQVQCWGLPATLAGLGQQTCQDNTRQDGVAFEVAGQNYFLESKGAGRINQLSGSERESCQPMRWQAVPGKDYSVPEPDQTHPEAICCKVVSEEESDDQIVRTEKQVCAQLARAKTETTCSTLSDEELLQTPIPGASEVVSLAPSALEGLYAVRSNGQVLFWGSGLRRELALASLTQPVHGTRVVRDRPAAVPELQGSQQLKETSYHGCAVFTGGQVRCWGAQYNFGLLGNGVSMGESQKPVVVKGLGPSVYVGLGHVHSCALQQDGQVKCWGHNTAGELGSGSTAKFSAVPVSVKGVQVIF